MAKENKKGLGEICIWCVAAAISAIPLLLILWFLLK